MINSLSLSFIFLSLFLFIGNYVICKVIYNKEKGESYSLLNCFPDELYIRGKSSFNYSVLFQIYIGCLFISGIIYLLPFSLERSYLLQYKGICIACLILNIVESVSLYLSNFIFNIKKDYKNHLTCTLIYWVSLLFKVFLFSYFFYVVKDYFDFPCLVSSIIFLCIGVILLSLYVNPRLKDWYKLDREVTSTNEVLIKRPKVFVLAFSEWVVLLAELIFSVVLFTSFFLMY